MLFKTTSASCVLNSIFFMWFVACCGGGSTCTGVVLPAQLDCVIPTAKAGGFAQLQFPSVVRKPLEAMGKVVVRGTPRCSAEGVSPQSPESVLCDISPGSPCSASDLCCPLHRGTFHLWAVLSWPPTADFIHPHWAKQWAFYSLPLPKKSLCPHFA